MAKAGFSSRSTITLDFIQRGLRQNPCFPNFITYPMRRDMQKDEYGILDYCSDKLVPVFVRVNHIRRKLYDN